MGTPRPFPTGLAGTAATLAVVAAAAFGGVGTGGLFDPAALLLVVAGTCTVTLAAADPTEVGTVLAWLRAAPAALRPVEPAVRIRELAALAARLRRRPPREVELEAGRLPSRSVLAQGLVLLLEGRDAAELERLLEVAVEGSGRAAETASALAARAGETAPAMGLVGTLLGLVGMLGRLERPEEIGPGLALALLTTLYGALLAHVLFLPLARRLALAAARARLLARLEAETVLALARDEHPDLLAGRLAAIAGAPPAAVLTGR